MKNFYKNQKSFDILSPRKLFSQINNLREIKYWSKVLNRPNGWHYDLDIIWILNKLIEYDIKPGGWILDAGAGQGLLQFILASRGYNVISYDYSDRDVLFRAKSIFQITNEKKEIEFKHKYMANIKYAPKNSNINSIFSYIKRCGLKVFLKNGFDWLVNFLIFCYEFISKRNKNYGSIVMRRGSFQDLSKFNFKVDAIVSLSAIEHCDKEQIKECLEQMFRKVSKGPMLITTSINSLTEDSYENYFCSWTFGKNSLLELFNVSVQEKEIDSVQTEIQKNNLFWNRLDSYYFQRKDSYFYKNKNVPYVPIGIDYFNKY
ncbi:class I SAM-dependent methyltransferase [Prochlorococcus marinus]|jgi:cyclopropane fatty-acyl-phospholipid synthase-like methyltransferase|uniref:Methyltransferase type 11 domain-containing protein n=1 Tax=Prochlorococcus marinus (strain MIT 9301) TaxID=167546 RepID=A3PE68_PROM0|nr:class I SAM-dependent methyltransferase [Prochlorococcus marinus]ABO18043.1 Hypothetical protein P9301_14201 [Prochlorococcus marinus str. MIT 9301]